MAETLADVQDALRTFTGTENNNVIVWEPFVEILNKNNWTAYEYMNFIYMNTESRAMVIKRLSSDTLLKLYADKRQSWQDAYIWKFQWVLERVRDRLSDGQSLEDIIRDEELHISSLAMYGITCSGDMSVSSKFEGAASFELKCYPTVRDLFLSVFDGGCLP
jgi:hypothetical protein